VKALLLCLLLVFGAGIAHAQAWTPEAKTLNVDGAYQLGYSNRTETVAVTVIHHLFIPSLEYGITDNLAVSASLPIMAVKAEGGTPHGSWDDGGYHGTSTDLRVTARYMFPIGVVAITPQIGASSPIRDYEVQGNAAAGRGLKAAYAGINFGADLDEWAPRTTFHATYEFALVEHFTGAGPEGEALDQNFSVFTAQIGHTVAKLQMHLGVDYHHNHGGITFAQFGTTEITMLEQKNHDPILLERALLAGGGLSYDVSEHTNLYATARVFVKGENTHNGSVFAVGASWDFGL
jgi:hypothetical protein